MRADYVVTAVRTGGWRGPGVIAGRREGHARLRGHPQAGQDGLALQSDTAELSYTDVRVPAANLVGAENTGFQQIAAAFVSGTGRPLPPRRIRARSAALDLTAQWCRDRETFGRPLISRQSVQNTLAEMARRVDVARVYARAASSNANWRARPT